MDGWVKPYGAHRWHLVLNRQDLSLCRGWGKGSQAVLSEPPQGEPRCEACALADMDRHPERS